MPSSTLIVFAIGNAFIIKNKSNYILLKNVFKSFASNHPGSWLKFIFILLTTGGYAYSVGAYSSWPWLASQAAAEAMAVQVAKWPSLYKIYGIDLDIETGAGDQPNAGVNMVYFIKKLRQLVPNIYIGQPTFGYPQVHLFIKKNKLNFIYF